MRKFVYILVGLVVLSATVLLAIQRRKPPTTLEGLYAKYHQRGHTVGIDSPFSGAVLVARGEEVVFKQTYGFADLERNEPLEVDSRFLVGSSAKPFTATLVLQQVEAGVLDLDGAVTDYLPDFPGDPGARISLHHLLSHTAGLSRDAGEGNKLTLSYEPGSAYAFSNFGYELLVSILETATGESYEALLDSGIVTPLGLANTGFGTREALAEEAVSGLSFRKHEFPVTMFAPGEGSYDTMARPEAGAAYSTLDDLHRFIRGLRANELLSDTMTERMFEPVHQGSAYGWFRNRQSLFERNPDAPLYSHAGRLGGHNVLLAIYDEGTTAIVLSNVDPLDTVEIMTATYFATHGSSEVPSSLKHPSLSNPKAFQRGGGAKAFLAYYRALSERAGYPVHPPTGHWSQVVQLLIRDKAYAEAADFADSAIEDWAPSSPEALNIIGYAFARRERYEEARRYFERNIELFQDVANGYDSLGELHELEGNLELAREQYTRALKLSQQTDDPMQHFYEQRLSDVEEKMAERPAG